MAFLDTLHPLGVFSTGDGGLFSRNTVQLAISAWAILGCIINFHCTHMAICMKPSGVCAMQAIKSLSRTYEIAVGLGLIE
jgi:hypothetical protein